MLINCHKYSMRSSFHLYFTDEETVFGEANNSLSQAPN